MAEIKKPASHNMRIFVKVKTGKRETSVAKLDQTNFIVTVKARPQQGQANAAVIAALADYFHVPKFALKIISGRSSKNKIISVQG